MTAAAKTPEGAELLDRAVEFLLRFVVFSNRHQAVALALWVLHTHAFEAADATPYPLITSPEKRSGKSRLLEVLELLAAKSWRVSGVSEAVLFRKIKKDVPTLLLDEIDSIFATYAEKTEPLRGIINAGNRRGGFVARCVPPNHETEDFSVFCPKSLAGIETRRLPETIRDRSIPIRMQRKRNEKVERFRYRVAKDEADGLRAEIAAWAQEHLDPLRDLYPDLPDGLNDRAAEGWEPLLAIAEIVGGDWVEKAHAAAVALSADVDVEDDSWGVQLLTDLRRVWDLDELGATLFSSEMCDRLKGLEDGPWRSWGKNRKQVGLTPRDLATFLRRYGIKSRSVRVGERTAKGYHYEELVDVWERYVPAESEKGES